jgi:glycerophosphoryl diester phosphodiesterase
MRLLLSLILVIFPGATALLAAEPDKLVIAHRGASGYLPEHTLEAKVLAFAQGADFIEQDVVMTRDDALVVMHDLTLERTTNVASVFPGRARDDGGYYVIDFTLQELRQLDVSEGAHQEGDARVANFPQRFPVGHTRFAIHTLQEELELTAGLAHSTGRTVGIYPELKSPWFHHQHGKDLAAAVLRTLKAYGYDSRDDAVYIQSFDHAELLRLRNELLPGLGMDVKLVQLIAENDWLETYERDGSGAWKPYDYSWMLTAEGLQTLATLVDGVGPSFGALVEADQRHATPNAIVGLAHAAGLQVHPFTFRKDAGQIPAYADSLPGLIEFFLYDVGVDGVFTDFPDEAVRVIQNHRH